MCFIQTFWLHYLLKGEANIIGWSRALTCEEDWPSLLAFVWGLFSNDLEAAAASFSLSSLLLCRTMVYKGSSAVWCGIEIAKTANK